MKRTAMIILALAYALVLAQGLALAQGQGHTGPAPADPCLVWGPLISFFVQLFKGWIPWVRERPQVVAGIFSAIATVVSSLGGSADIVAVLICFATTLGLSVGTYEVLIKRFARRPAA